MKNKRKAQSFSAAKSVVPTGITVEIILDKYSETASRELQGHRLKQAVQKDMNLLGKYNFFGNRIKSTD